MGVLPDIDISVQDGGLGRAGSTSDILGAVGVGSVAQSGVVLLSSFEDVRTKVGDGPLRDFLAGVYSQVTVPCYAKVLPGSTAGTISAITSGSSNAGVGSLTAAGSPANAYSLKVVVESDGGLNSATFHINRNGLKGKEITVPQNGSYAIPNTGITLTFSPGSPSSGQVSFKKGDEFSFTTTVPSATNEELLSGVDDLKNAGAELRHIAVAGITASAFWAAFAAKLESYTDEHLWTWGSAAARARSSSEAADAYISALAGSERGSVWSKRLMVSAAWLDVVDIEGLRAKRNAHGKLIGRIFGNNVATSPGWTRLGPLPGVEKILYDLTPTSIKTLGNVGYATCRHYDGKKGVYVSDSHLMTDDTSDFDTSIRIEVMNKACRVVREAQFPYLKQGFDVLSDGRVPELEQVVAAGEQALDLMARDKEISSGKIEIADDQDILATKSISEEITIIPRGQIDEIKATIRFENPNLGGNE